jgi:large subunit ribosomal protein L35
MRKKVARSKTNKAVAKRFKVTGSGKIVRHKTGRRHLLSCKNRKRKRSLSRTTTVDSRLRDHVVELLPFSH